MKRKNMTRNALVTSIISMLLCVSMLVGTTFAWFTDEVTSGMNTIAAGNLDVDVYYGDPADENSIADINTLFNDVALWEPGVVAYENLTVANLGTLALKFRLGINFGNENTVNGYGLSDVLKVAILDEHVTGNDRDKLVADIPASDWALLSRLEEEGTLYPAGSTAGASTQQFAIVIWWEPSDQDNNWNVNNGKTTSDGAKNLHIDLGVNVVATQLMHEEDSFGDDYDENSKYSIDVATAEELAAALKVGGTINVTNDITVTEPLEIPADATVALNLNDNAISASFDKNTGAVLVNNGTLSIYGGEIANTALNGGAAIDNKGIMTLDGVTVKGGEMDSTGYPAYTVMTSGKLTVEEGTSIESNRGAISMINGAEVVINGGSFVVSNAADGRNMTLHVIYAYGYNSKLTIYDGYFEQNHTSTGGASVICPAGATINIYGGDYRDSMDDTNWTSTGNFQNYMGYGAPVNVYGGTYDDTTVNKNLAAGYVAHDNGDGTWTVGLPKASNENELFDKLNNGEGVQLSQDVSTGRDFTAASTNIDLGGNTLSLTSSDHKVSGELTVKNGTVDASKGYFDVRSTTDSAIVFEDVDFINTTKSKTFGNSTDYVESAIEICPAVNGVKNTVIFRGCTFVNTQVIIEGMSGKEGIVEVIFEDCTFTNFGNSDFIDVRNYMTCDITIKDCTFNATATANICVVDALSSSTVNVKFEGANTVNGTAATPTTDPALVGTVDEVKVFNTQSVKLVGIGVDTKDGLDTVTVTGIATK